jgi:hypothetical protein
MKEHPFAPFAEAMHSSVVKAAAYFLAWILGVNLPPLFERLLFFGIRGRFPNYRDEDSLGVLTLTLIAHPLGFFILSSHIVLFALFVRFDLRYRWVLWPLASGVFWRLWLEEIW